MTVKPEPTSLEITDFTEAPTYADGPISRWCREALYDARDEVFVRLSLEMVVLMTALMSVLFVAVRHAPISPWLPMAVYAALWGWFTPPVILMLHNTMHRSFIRKPKLLGRLHPYVMTFFFGIPSGYREHHLGVHHTEDNMPGDLSSTMRYQRDSFASFLLYFGRFFFFSIIEVPLYLYRHRRYAMSRRALFGELGHLAVIAAALLVDWRFGVAAFVFPYVSCRFMMMVGNWGQHAFVNTGRKNGGLANSVTCINATYNRRCFNDGYHIGHHLKANRHWTELPSELLANRETYAREGAIVFEGIDFFMVSVLLFAGRYDVLARRFVRLDGEPRSDADVIAMLEERVKPVRVWPAESIGVAAG